MGDVLIYRFDGDLWNRCVFKILDTLGGGEGFLFVTFRRVVFLKY